MDVGLDHHRIHPHLASTGDLRRARQFDRPLVERGYGPRSDHVRPPDEGGVVGSTLQVEPTELPQDDRIGDEMLGLLITPVVEALDDEHPQD